MLPKLYLKITQVIMPSLKLIDHFLHASINNSQLTDPHHIKAYKPLPAFTKVLKLIII